MAPMALLSVPSNRIILSEFTQRDTVFPHSEASGRELLVKSFIGGGFARNYLDASWINLYLKLLSLQKTGELYSVAWQHQAIFSVNFPKMRLVIHCRFPERTCCNHTAISRGNHRQYRGPTPRHLRHSVPKPRGVRCSCAADSGFCSAFSPTPSPVAQIDMRQAERPRAVDVVEDHERASERLSRFGLKKE